MKEKKKYDLKRELIILFVMVISVVALALHATAIPSLTTTTWSDATKVNISFGTGDQAGNATKNITVFISSALTANSSTSKLINISNTTATDFNYGYANFTFDNTLVAEDSNDYTVSFVTTGIGDADAVAGTSATGVVIDRSKPNTPVSLSPTGDDTSTQDKTFSATVNGANVTGCTLRFDGTNPGSSVYSMSNSGDSCTVSLTNIARSTYSYRIRASDGTNTTESELASFSLSKSSSGSGARAYAVAYYNQQPASKQGVATALGIQSQGGTASTSGFNLQKELTAPELTKTGIGAGVGAVVGMLGIVLGPGVAITVPVGALIGGIIGLVV